MVGSTPPVPIRRLGMTKAELLRQIRVKFIIKLNEKTGWGKTEVLKAYDEIVQEVCYDIIDGEN